MKRVTSISTTVCLFLVILAGLSIANTELSTNTKADQHFEKANELSKLSDYDAAIAEYKKVISSSPKSKVAWNAQYWIGQSYFEMGHFDDALSAFQTLLNEYPTSTIIDSTKLMIERVQQAKKNRALFGAAEDGDVDRVKQLIAEDADVNTEWGDINTKEEEESTPLWQLEDTPLVYAVRSGKMEVVKLLVEAGADVNAGQWPPLPTAVGKENMAMVEYLIDHGADVDFNDDGWTLLMESFSSGKEMVKLLIDRGADIHVQCKWTGGTGALHRAVRYGYRDITELIIQRGFDVNAGPWTALHIAAETGRKDMAELLIQKGANVNVIGTRDRSPLYVAASRGNTNVAELLIANGANVNVKNDNEQTPLEIAASKGWKALVEMLIARGADVNSGRWTPLIGAAERGHKEVVEFLIAKGADVDLKVRGLRPLGIAARSGHKEIVEFLIANGAKSHPLHLAAFRGDLEDVKRLIEAGSEADLKDECEYTPLSWALWTERKDVVKFLIAKGADVNVKDVHGMSPLDWVSSNGKLDIVELLISGGADVNQDPSTYGYSPLYNASVQRHLNVVKLLIAKGADVNAKVGLKRTALFYGDKDIAEVLIAHGADVSARDKSNQTPLHRSCEFGLEDKAEFLIAKGADVNAKDNEGRTPLWLARKKGHAEIVKLLRKHGAKE